MLNPVERLRDPHRVESFFARVLPLRVFQNQLVHQSADGAIGLIIQGVGRWTLQFGGDLSDAVREGVAEPVDMTLVFRPEVFEALLDGVAPQLNRGFYISGDVNWLDRLRRILETPRGLHAVS